MFSFRSRENAVGQINRLTDKRVRAEKTPGLHADGAGLYLRVDETGARRWVYIFHLAGRRREMGLGSLEVVTLKAAREAAEAARQLARAGKDPIIERNRARGDNRPKRFHEVADALMDDLEPSWRSPKQRGQWTASLKQHAPAIWVSYIQDVDTEMVLHALRPIWTTHPETATRVRSRLERILDAAKVKGLTTGENPARWRGHLALLLPVQKVVKGHHKALPYAEVPAVMARLAEKDGHSALALRFTVLTAARSGEVRGMTWEEIDGDRWTVPAERMKAGREHVVPLSTDARALLNGIDEIHRDGLVFRGAKGGKLSDMALSMLLRKMKVDATPHGFRSSFRDWAGDCTSFARETAEEALAHVVGNSVERAYRRGSAIEKRRLLLQAWSDFCAGRVGQIIQLQTRA
jgi:integrase